VNLLYPPSTPKKMSRQEVFNKVYTHLLKQMRRSIEGGRCHYRGPNGLKCAVGVLIPDNRYSPKMEGKHLHGIFEEISDLFESETHMVALLARLQEIHDSYSPDQWKDRLKELAAGWKLNIPPSMYMLQEYTCTDYFEQLTVVCVSRDKAALIARCEEHIWTDSTQLHTIFRSRTEHHYYITEIEELV